MDEPVVVTVLAAGGGIIVEGEAVYGGVLTGAEDQLVGYIIPDVVGEMS